MFFCVMKMCDLKSFSYVMIKTLLVFIHFQKFLMFYFRKLNRGDSLEMQIYLSRAENDSIQITWAHLTLKFHVANVYAD